MTDGDTVFEGPDSVSLWLFVSFFFFFFINLDFEVDYSKAANQSRLFKNTDSYSINSRVLLRPFNRLPLFYGVFARRVF